MITWNKEITKEEALELFNSKEGMNFPDTAHNRAMIKECVDEQIKNLISKRDVKLA